MTDMTKPESWRVWGLAGRKSWANMCKGDVPCRVVNGSVDDTIGYFVPIAMVRHAQQEVAGTLKTMLSFSMEGTRGQLLGVPLPTRILYGGKDDGDLGYFFTPPAFKRVRKFIRQPA